MPEVERRPPPAVVGELVRRGATATGSETAPAPNDASAAHARRASANDPLQALLRRGVSERVLQRFPYLDLVKSQKKPSVTAVATLRGLVRAADAKILDDAAADAALTRLANFCTNNKQLIDLLTAVPNRARLTNLFNWIDNGQNSGTDLEAMLTRTDGVTLGKIRPHHTKPTAKRFLDDRRTFWTGETSTTVPAAAVAVAEGKREKLPGDEFRLEGAKYKGMTRFDNDGTRRGTMILPTREIAKADAITYQELDIHPWKPLVDRGPERIVLGSNDTRYYTADHYVTFVAF